MFTFLGSPRKIRLMSTNVRAFISSREVRLGVPDAVQASLKQVLYSKLRYTAYNDLEDVPDNVEAVERLLWPARSACSVPRGVGQPINV